MESTSQTHLLRARSRLPGSVLLTLLALLAALSLLAACTRDRPAPESASTPVPEGVEPQGGTDAMLEPVVAQDGVVVTSGEPEVETSLPVSGTDGLEAGVEGGVTIGEYEVQPGDTLLSIAIRFTSSTDELRNLNFLTSDLIQVGQRLRVPMVPPTPTPTPAPYFYTVKSGDSLLAIAQAHGISMVDIMAANQMADANALRAGMELEIPGYAPEGAATGDEGAAEGSAATADDGSGPAIHIVQPGQTLTQIAQIYGVTPTALANANNVSNRNILRTGAQLTIPGLTAKQAEDARAIRHTVRSGEMLSEIARQYGVRVNDIVRANNLANPNSVYVGQVLIIPQPVAQ